jgi:thioredoxin:protein disulfide reductase
MVTQFKLQSWLGIFLLSCLAFYSHFTWAEESLRSAEAAFPIQVQSIEPDQISISWSIPENYYLYQHKVAVHQDQQRLQLNLPQAHDLYDENYGHTQVYYQALKFNIPSQPLQTYQVTWQGCAKDRLCYPPQQISFSTDLNGLVTALPKKNNSLLELSQQTSQQNKSFIAAQDQTSALAQDEQWLDQLHTHPFIYSVVLFIGLGILLAFTPCSLPMLPILTALIVRERRGLQAGWIALVFVLAMASVYAVLGLIAASAGLNFQRWLQQPLSLILFATLFVTFALNLFGLFELKLPQSVVTRLDRMQGAQQSGTLVGAAVMGTLSALLVGPCMTAPLAGALLFISQNQNQLQGALLLFALGLGMGFPLLLASILGSRILPKAGQWMQQIRILFAFLMLGLALYFVRPLLADYILLAMQTLLVIAFSLYLLYKIYRGVGRFKWFYLAILLCIVPYFAYEQWQNFSRQSSIENTQTWHVAKTAEEFQDLLKHAPQQNILIDVYADWCVACQPIEKRVLQTPEVQHALQDYYLIKLDLSAYQASHAALLKQWQVLGPPTFVFLDASRQEQRHLRLTGSVTEQQLLQKLQQ